MINHSYEEAKRLLNENREVLDKIAEYLYEHETITGKEFMKIFRELKGIPGTGTGNGSSSIGRYVCG